MVPRGHGHHHSDHRGHYHGALPDGLVSGPVLNDRSPRDRSQTGRAKILRMAAGETQTSRREKAFRREMEGQGGAVSSWGNPPGDRYAPHSHPYRKVVCCIEGSIVFCMAEGDAELSAGERLVIEPGTMHTALVGPRGVRCAEAQFA